MRDGGFPQIVCSGRAREWPIVRCPSVVVVATAERASASRDLGIRGVMSFEGRAVGTVVHAQHADSVPPEVMARDQSSFNTLAEPPKNSTAATM